MKKKDYVQWGNVSRLMDSSKVVGHLWGLTLTVTDIVGEFQYYSIEKTVDKKQVEIYRCDNCQVTFSEAKKRVEYLARCFTHGIVPVYTDWEKKDSTIGDILSSIKPRSIKKVHDVWLGGLYHHKETDMYVIVSLITNIIPPGHPEVPSIFRIPSVVLSDVFKVQSYTVSINQFLKSGFYRYCDYNRRLYKRNQINNPRLG